MKKNTLLTILAASLALAASAHATDIFNANGFDTDTTVNFTIKNGTSADLAWESGNGGRYKQISGTNVISIYNAAESENFTDYTVSASFVDNSRGGVSPVGVVARYRDNTNFYSGRLIAGTSDSLWTVEIYRFGGAGNLQLAKSATFTFEKGADTLYHGRLEFSVVGTNLNLKFYNAEVGGTMLADIDATDTAFTKGSAGFRSTVTGGVLAYTEFSIAATAVPEPATTAALMGAVLLGAIVIFRRIRARA
ncbi:cell wall anchor protein [Opitutaceae bacterium TAV4]|nr:cell wall anchor protein [Opitutaceae bacterium TAV4]RRJ99757.1 cell wall anchor protein [Opitutaceae bacterium TAV3]